MVLDVALLLLLGADGFNQQVQVLVKRLDVEVELNDLNDVHLRLGKLFNAPPLAF